MLYSAGQQDCLGGGAVDGGAGIRHQRHARGRALAGLASLALGFGAQNLVRDIIAGFHIIIEDQFVVGDTIQVGDTMDALNILPSAHRPARSAGRPGDPFNGDIRTVGNLSRDWSQAFVDVAVSPQIAQEKTLQPLKPRLPNFAMIPRGPRRWWMARACLDCSPYDQTASTVRLQVRTAPSRQEDVARELRRRIQLEFQRQGIPLWMCSVGTGESRCFAGTGATSPVRLKKRRLADGTDHL